MTAKIFSHKGHVGVEIDMKGNFLNDPMGSGQLGCVISTKEIEITQDAKDIIKSAKRSGGSFAELMLTKHANDGDSSIGVMGFAKVYLGDKIEIGRTCEISVLDDCTLVTDEAPQDFKDAINDLIKED